ncbi:glutamine amidotransferase [Microbacterium sp. SSW1-47]|uniref:glutamine amidotransferase n=1 Tax=Microbacterium sufflavum TaxID=2851649 RepID=UPI001FFCC6ED|nr:glutamine amidotransferase [Microbacterium sufflavum]MCK2025023.1 glutamine amidotransferase [Microbacterium sufflavum]
MSASTPTRTALALRHVAFEDLGILAPLLEERGYRVRYHDAGVDELDRAEVASADLVVVLGGPIGVYDDDRYPFLAPAKDALSARLAADRPTLGICLGAQVLAEALGARVAPTGGVEIGYAPVDLTPDGRTSPLSALDGEPVLHWHGDAFEIPPGARHLARTPGFPHQAFSRGRALGLQFHVEADHRTIERWLIGHAHELHHRGIDPRSIRRQAAVHGPRLEHRARTAIGTWLDEVEPAH